MVVENSNSVSASGVTGTTVIPVAYAYNVDPGGNMDGTWILQEIKNAGHEGTVHGQLTDSGELSYTLTLDDPDCPTAFNGTGTQDNENFTMKAYGGFCDHPELVTNSSGTVLWDSNDDMTGLRIDAYISSSSGSVVTILAVAVADDDPYSIAAGYREYGADASGKVRLLTDWLMYGVLTSTSLDCSPYTYERLVFINMENSDRCVTVIKNYDDESIDIKNSRHRSASNLDRLL